MKSIYIIPCYNEENNLKKLIENCSEINKKNKNINFLLVNNGSLDNTEVKLKELSTNHEFISTYSIKENIGYGFGIKSGILNALELDQYDAIGWTHADLQIPLNTLLEATKIAENTSLGKENYYIRGRRITRPYFIDKVFTLLMGIYTSIVHFGLYWDITGLPVVTNKKFIKEIINEAPNGFALDVYTYVKAKKNKSKVIRFDVEFLEREAGESSWNNGVNAKLKMSIYYLKEILKI